MPVGLLASDEARVPFGFGPFTQTPSSRCSLRLHLGGFTGGGGVLSATDVVGVGAGVGTGTTTGGAMGLAPFASGITSI
jgi:hypothetical protein